MDRLYFELERFKRERSWHNLNLSKQGIISLLSDTSWYRLFLPETRLNPQNYDEVLILQQIAIELVKRFCEKYYNFCKKSYIEPRLELRELTADDDNLPSDKEYQLIVDGDDIQVIEGIKKLKAEIIAKKDQLLPVGDLHACNFGNHLFQPLFHVRHGGHITILPVS
jgi:hypothetical protein